MIVSSFLMRECGAFHEVEDVRRRSNPSGNAKETKWVNLVERMKMLLALLEPIDNKSSSLSPVVGWLVGTTTISCSKFVKL